ncbi:MAG TPA: sulfotransferase, partial [Opitutales bacterium]|nr:sulfotransferase [Opitutales bacterium]
NLDAQISLAAILARTSSVEAARPVVNRCLELDPGCEQGRYLSAQLDRRENSLEDAERQFRDMIASGLRQPYIHYSSHYELAQILDRTGRFDEAMAELAEAKRLARQTVNVEAELKMFDSWHEGVVKKARAMPKNVLGIWTKSFPPRVQNAAARVAFLGGPERSGTTLLERILDAHPAVAACDECLAISKVLSAIDVTGPAIPGQRLEVLRQRYVKILTKSLGQTGEGKLLLDKNPPQTVWLPSFLRAFPESRVLIALRDPRDVILSLYFQNHTHSNYLTFEQLAQHYGSVMEVWLAVREWEGLAWMETRYEDIVADMQKEGGRVTQFLGLEWHEGQARYYERNREKAVMSTNYSDVTQPVYKRSVGRWRAYERQLDPILPALEPYCRKFGYA